MDDERDPYEHEYIDEKGVSYHHYREYVLLELLGMCGCYDTQIENDVVVMLHCLNRGGFPYDSFLAPGLRDHERAYIELILHMLDHAGLTEHGSSVRGSWITNKGRLVADRLRQEEEAGE
jgi:hypothetical protein